MAVDHSFEKNSTNNIEYSDTRSYSTQDRKKGGGFRLFLILIVLALLAYFVYRHFSHAQKAEEHSGKDGKSRVSTVSAVPLKIGDINVYLNAIGTVTPRSTVVIRSRVDGELMRVLFKEGQYVKQGELLAEVDPRAYQVLLTQAQGQMARDQALLKNAQLDLERYKKLLEQDSAPEQQVATQSSLVNQYLGAIQTDQSQIDNARLQLSYTRIIAPTSGRIGLRQVDPGNIVHASDANGILSIAQVKPITVIFSIPQDNLSAVLEPLHKGQKLPVLVYGRDQKNKLAEGYLFSTDNQIDTTTGTVKLRAEFANEDEALFPNQFVNVRVLLGINQNAKLVANAAVQRGSQGNFVYAVKADNTVAVKPVKAIVTEGDVTAVDGDLAEGELLVTDGADKLRAGAKVQLAKAGGKRGEHRANKNGGKGGENNATSGAENSGRDSADSSPPASAQPVGTQPADAQVNTAQDPQPGGEHKHRHRQPAE